MLCITPFGVMFCSAELMELNEPEPVSSILLANPTRFANTYDIDAWQEYLENLDPPSYDYR